MRETSPTVVKRQRRNFINGRIARRPRNSPRPLQTRSQPLSTPASVYQPSIDTNLERETISNIYVEDHPISSNYNTCSTPGYIQPNQPWPAFHLAADGLPDQSRHRPQPLQEYQEAVNVLADLKDNFRLWARNMFTIIQNQEQGPAKIYERDFRLILHEHHFCDNLIDYYFELIVHRCRLAPQIVVSVSATITRRIIRGGLRLPRIRDDAHLILFPVRYVDNVDCPWSLVIADLANTKITYYKPVEENNANFTNPFVVALERRYPRTRNAWTSEEAVVPVKCPDDDKPLSGLFICDFADSFVQYKPPTLRERNVGLTILHLFDDICRGGVPLQAERHRSVSDIRQFLEQFLENLPNVQQRVVVSFGGVDVSNTDELTLKGNCFLSPNVVDMYFVLIENHWMKRSRHERNLPDLRVIRSTYSSHFINGTETMERIFRETCHGGLTYFPVRDPASHQWVLLVIDEPNRTFSYYNPRWYPDDRDFVPLYVRLMPQWYDLFAGFQLGAFCEIPPAVNKYDSGIYVCRYARELAESLPLDEAPFNDLNLPHLRGTMMFELRDMELQDIMLSHV